MRWAWAHTRVVGVQKSLDAGLTEGSAILVGVINAGRRRFVARYSGAR